MRGRDFLLYTDSAVVSSDKSFRRTLREIVNRAGALISSDEATCAKARLSVGDGMYSVGDYLISVFTSPEYLLMGRDDSVFAL